MKKSLVLALFLVVLLTGCIHYQENMSLTRQGSGQITFRTGILDMEAFLEEDFSDSLISSEDAAELEDYPGISVVEAKNYVEAGMEWSEVTLEFESLEALDNALGQGEFVPVGFVSLTQEGGYYLYKRQPPHLLAQTADDADLGPYEQMPKEMFAMFLGDARWDYEVSLPGRIVESNGEQAGETISWSYKLADLLEQDVEMWVKFAF